MSWDDSFPTPFRHDDGTEEPGDYSEASVIYMVKKTEGLFPVRIRKQIHWVRVARPMMI